jgi:bifunctional UDP-N-acetylglucosamine pyrophosphorylase/glucosamine-1-phosphate N-acetyltransferase
MARLRPGTVLHDNVKIGNFVELKKAELGDGSKASHLSYLGDVTVGQNVNIGCGFVACNYDGLNKHHSTIEDGVFIGSDSQILSPVRVGKGAYIATSTTVTHDVPPGALVISRVKQMIKPGYVDKLMKKLKGKGHT